MKTINDVMSQERYNELKEIHKRIDENSIVTFHIFRTKLFNMFTIMLFLLTALSIYIDTPDMFLLEIYLGTLVGSLCLNIYLYEHDLIKIGLKNGTLFLRNSSKSDNYGVEI